MDTAELLSTCLQGIAAFEMRLIIFALQRFVLCSKFFGVATPFHPSLSSLVPCSFSTTTTLLLARYALQNSATTFSTSSSATQTAAHPHVSLSYHRLSLTCSPPSSFDMVFLDRFQKCRAKVHIYQTLNLLINNPPHPHFSARLFCLSGSISSTSLSSFVCFCSCDVIVLNTALNPGAHI